MLISLMLGIARISSTLLSLKREIRSFRTSGLNKLKSLHWVNVDKKRLWNPKLLKKTLSEIQ